MSEYDSWRPQTLTPTGLRDSDESTEPYIVWDIMGQAVLDMKEQQFIEGTNEEGETHVDFLILQ